MLLLLRRGFNVNVANNVVTLLFYWIVLCVSYICKTYKINVIFNEWMKLEMKHFETSNENPDQYIFASSIQITYGLEIVKIWTQILLM